MYFINHSGFISDIKKTVPVCTRFCIEILPFPSLISDPGLSAFKFIHNNPDGERFVLVFLFICSDIIHIYHISVPYE
jgi:hypothetical protein